MHATSSCMDPWKVHVCSRLTLRSLSWFSRLLTLDSVSDVDPLHLPPMQFKIPIADFSNYNDYKSDDDATSHCRCRSRLSDSLRCCNGCLRIIKQCFLERSVFSLTSSRSWDLETAGRRQLTDNASSPLKRWISCLFCKVFSSSFSRAHSLPVYLLVVFLQIVVSECFLAHCLLPVAADMLYLLLVDWKFWSSTIVVVLSPLLFALPVHIFKAFSELNNTTKDQFCVFVAKFSWWWCTLSVCWIGCKEMMRNSQRLPSPLLLWSLLVVKYKPNWQQPISSGHFLFHKICADFVLPRICCFVLA